MKSRIVIGVPSKGQVESMFAYDLARLTGFIGASMIPDLVESLRLYFVDGTLIAPQRHEIAQTALAVGATHILWLDADMRFPKDTLARLLQHGKPIVGASYAGRRIPFGTTAYRYQPDGKPEVVYTYPWSKGLESVDVVGMGCLLTATEVFQKVPEPWFPIQWGNPRGDWLIHGEDAGFCEWAKEAGYDILIDHDLSQEVRHTGIFEYMHSHALIQKDDLRLEGRFVVPETPPEPKPLILESA